MKAEAVHPSQLSEADLAAWRAIRAADARWSTPYLSPEWAQAVGRVRADARVVLFRDGERAVGFLPVQRPNGFAAVPAGGAICDYQAIVAASETVIDPQLAARALGVGRIDMPCALAACSQTGGEVGSGGHLVAFAQGWDAYGAELKARGSKVLSRADKRLRKMGRDTTAAGQGEVSFEAFCADEAVFNMLIGWKREQYARTGVKDIFAHDWVDTLVRDTFRRPSNDDFGGAMFVLRVGGKPVSILYCLRSGRALHAWFTAYDPEWAEHSPGLLTFVEAIRASAATGFTEMDLGPGDYQFKESLATGVRAAAPAFIGAPSVSAALRAAEFGVRRMAESLPLGRASQWPGKAMRRLDILAGLA
jgi:CelD/BcsL family acetyltransferase involved in cellulose biosynthesis